MTDRGGRDVGLLSPCGRSAGKSATVRVVTRTAEFAGVPERQPIVMRRPPASRQISVPPKRPVARNPVEPMAQKLLSLAAAQWSLFATGGIPFHSDVPGAREAGMSLLTRRRWVVTLVVWFLLGSATHLGAQCRTAQLYCPGACSMTVGSSIMLLDFSCFPCRWCNWTQIYVYTYNNGNPEEPCNTLCDFGWDGYCEWSCD